MKLRKFVKKIIGRFPQKETKNIVDINIVFSGLVDRKIVTKSHQSILGIAQQNDIDIPHYCGGYCRCATCVVQIIENPSNISKASGNEIMVLGIDKFEKGHRLACQAYIHGDAEIFIPEWF